MEGRMNSGNDPHSRWRAGIVTWLLLPLVSPAQPVPAPVQEYQVKAAFLYNFAKFVDWPGEAAGADGPLVITVFGSDPFGPVLEQTVQGKTVGDRPLVVRRTTRLQDLRPCHVLFISPSEKIRLPEVLRAVGGERVLTVSDMEEFLHLGGIVKFVMEDNRVRFEVNARVARESGVRISSKLLKLARVVWE